VPSGSLSFANSPINNPNVNLHVSRTINQSASQTFRNNANEKLTVGLNITGYLNNLKIDFFSSPIDLSQDKILSYLLLGQTLSGSTGANLPALINAINSMGGDSSTLGGITNIQNTMRQKIGLTEMGVEAQDTIDSLGNTIDHQTAVVLGKYILPNIYVRYNIGLLDPVNTWQIRYILNHRWSIQSETNVRGSGFDLFYRIERG
jgi:translocation and assembly module TamB